MSDPIQRRDFFRGPPRQDNARSAIGDLGEADAKVVTLRAPAMACEFAVQFPLSQPDRQNAFAAFEWIENLEAQLSIYRDESEINLINRTAAESPVRVEPLLFSLLERCRTFHEISAGAFDVTAGPLVRAWGFLQRQGRVPLPQALAAALAKVGMQHLQFDAERRTVGFARQGMEINLAAVGKGYALDRVGGRLRRLGYDEALLSAGASSLLAIGRPHWDDAWRVELRHPLDRSRTLAIVRLVDAGFATGGVSEQRFFFEGKRLGHILDPRTGRPVEGMLQASALAPDAAEAEALSTAFFVNGLDWTEEFCQRRPDVGAVLIPDPGPGGELAFTLVGAMHDCIDLPGAD